MEGVFADLQLPPGFRFRPTDDELIIKYLHPKIHEAGFLTVVMGEIDLYSFEPRALPSMAKMKGEEEFYFFCFNDRKFSTGKRFNRAAPSGYWKSTGNDKPIKFRNALVGMKKTLVFYTGKAPNGSNSSWVMHEFRLGGHLLLPDISKGEWVVCRVFDKGLKHKAAPALPAADALDDGDVIISFASGLPAPSGSDDAGMVMLNRGEEEFSLLPGLVDVGEELLGSGSGLPELAAGVDAEEDPVMHFTNLWNWEYRDEYRC